MAYRVRRLKEHRRWVPNPLAYMKRFPGDREGMPSGDMVSEVAATEAELTHDEVLERLERRELRSTDLIFIHGTWTTLAKPQPFEEAAAPHARHERRLAALRAAVALLLVAGAVAAFFRYGL